MGADRIEREIEIDAPIEFVWSVVTEPDQMAIWFNDETHLEIEPGADGRFVWRRDGKGTQREMSVNVRVERCEPPHFFSFRWNYPDGAEPGPHNAPLVEFSLEGRGDSTYLRLVESGLNGIDKTDAEKESYLAEHTSGWDVIVGWLREYAVQQWSEKGSTVSGR